jgi:hypothetical protein
VLVEDRWSELTILGHCLGKLIAGPALAIGPAYLDHASSRWPPWCRRRADSCRFACPLEHRH